ncbi:MAG TPA: long-chain fatty acid--CoA ligase [Nitrospirota bacterium]|nr:long-chain fatty acid--CoA ligase [Nitrospirota bacterium]
MFFLFPEKIMRDATFCFSCFHNCAILPRMLKDILPLDYVLHNRATKTPHKTFIKFQGKKYTCQYIDELANTFAIFLIHHGMKQGDRVALLSHNCPEYIAAYFGIIRGGGIVLPLNNLLTHEEIDYILKDAHAKICLHDSDCAGTVQKLLRMNSRSFLHFSQIVASKQSSDSFITNQLSQHKADDISTVLYTSGTTGRPKGALLTHRNILVNAQSATQAFQITQKDRFVVFLPLFHSFTYTVCVIIPLITGAMISLLPSVRPFSRVVKSLIIDRITLFIAIPTVYKILADKNMPLIVKLLLNLRVCISGAAPLPVKVLREFEAAFKVPLLEGYGLTEASPVVSVNPLDPQKKKPGTVGLPLPGVEVKVVDDCGIPLPPGTPGELIVKGPNVMQGYLNKPEETAMAIRDGWLYTGDVASLDETGYIKIIDRKKDMIIVDGLNVYPYEVEEVLHRHPGIQDCAMIGVPHEHEEGKELAIMYVVLHSDANVTPKALRDYLSEHVAHYKIARRFIFTTDLPRNATGKIMKKELRNWYREKEITRPPL